MGWIFAETPLNAISRSTGAIESAEVRRFLAAAWRGGSRFRADWIGVNGVNKPEWNKKMKLTMSELRFSRCRLRNRFNRSAACLRAGQTGDTPSPSYKNEPKQFVGARRAGNVSVPGQASTLMLLTLSLLGLLMCRCRLLRNKSNRRLL
jgi:hypothetical protein